MAVYLLTSCLGYKGIPVNPVAKLVCEQIFLFPSCFGRAYLSAKNLSSTDYTDLFMYPKHKVSTPAPIRHKKKSEIMRSIEKNRKQGSNLPISIKLVVKIALVAVGFSVWGTGFVWVLAGWYIFLPVIRGILSFFVGVLAIILFILAILMFL
jgi:hypothetical protein